MNRHATGADTIWKRVSGLIPQVAASLAGAAALVAVFISSAIVWLCLTQPLTMADAVGDGQMTALLRVVAGFAVSVFERVIRYL
jgi:hypothetical protein